MYVWGKLDDKILHLSSVSPFSIVAFFDHISQIKMLLNINICMFGHNKYLTQTTGQMILTSK